MKRWLLLLCLLSYRAVASAHEGHSDDRPHSTAALVVADDQPRLQLSDARVEMVVAREGADWVIYLDDASSNAPLKGLSVQVQQGQRQVLAAPDGDDSYRLPVEMPEAGMPVHFTVRGAGWSSQLQGRLPRPGPHAPTAADAARSGIGRVLALGLLLFVLLAAGWWVSRRRGLR